MAPRTEPAESGVQASDTDREAAAAVPDVNDEIGSGLLDRHERPLPPHSHQHQSGRPPGAPPDSLRSRAVDGGRAQ